MIRIVNLSKSFRKRKALDDISLEFGPGVYGILGPNGAGKTTLLRCLTTLYPTPEGTIQYNGQWIGNHKTYLSNVGYLPQKFGLLKELTVREALQLFGDLKGMGKQKTNNQIDEVLLRVNLEDRAKSKVKTLSGGMVRRLGIAQALLGNPEILIFDEPTAGLDPEERLRFQSVIAMERGERTILISTHIVSDIEALCDTAIIMNEGRIPAQGSIAEITALADGKVYLVPEKKEREIEGAVHIQRRLRQDNEPMLKIITDCPQGFASLPPDMEDGYICCVKQI